jgi:hypothetical protein
VGGEKSSRHSEALGNARWSVRGTGRLYKPCTMASEILTTLAFWLRSSVVSVLNSLTTIMGAPPPLLVI